jgi:hypothetical protein
MGLTRYSPVNISPDAGRREVTRVGRPAHSRQTTTSRSNTEGNRARSTIASLYHNLLSLYGVPLIKPGGLGTN